MAKRYLDIEGLQTYDALIKQYIEDTITERLRDFKTTTTEEFNNIYDDVKTFNSKNDFPAVGVKDALYLSLDDGKFEAIFVKKPKNPIEFQETLNDTLSGKLNSKHFEYFRSSNFKIISEEPLNWTLDGEFGGKTDNVEIHNHERAIEFLRPNKG